MRNRKLIIALAAWVALVPFLGFPGTWENGFVVASGIIILFLSVDLSFLVRKKRPKARRRIIANEVYVEHAPSKGIDEYKGEVRM